MAGVLGRLPRRALCLLLAYHLVTASACRDPHYDIMMRDVCLTRFHEDMEAIGRPLWCDWGKTMKSYAQLTDCTRHVADRLRCFWPSAEVDKFFIAVHSHYFSRCPTSGRVVRDPPTNILCPFVMFPIGVTLLATAMVVWKNKRGEGIV